MPALVLLVAALVLNYDRHRHGKSTICSTTRRHVGPRMFLLGWSVLTAWLLPHYVRGFARAVVEFVDIDRPDPSNLPEEI